MFRLLLQVFLLIALVVITISESIETTEQNDVEKRGQQTLADVMKEFDNLKTSMNKELSDLKTKFVQMQMNRLRIMRGRDDRDGKDGTPGPAGRDGRDGKGGAPGPQGPRGSQGPSGQQGPRGHPARNGSGVEYIRWGKTSCPAGADTVYEGFMGGAHYDRYSGGSNYVCLTNNPKYLNYKPGLQGASYIHGTEYHVHHQVNPFSKTNLGDHDAPCVACHVTTRSAKLMIPGTYQCPSGWTREYYGYLMAERYNHKHSTEYICVDRDPEVVPGTNTDHNGALLYAVEGVCGSLPCLPYVQGRELTCVLCTK